MHLRRIAVLGLATSPAACYVYEPVSRLTPPPGREVRIELTEFGTTEVARSVGPNVVTLLGRLVSNSPDGYRVAIDAVRTARGGEQPWEGEGSVDVPAAAIARVEARTFSRERTILLATGLVVGAVAVVAGANALGNDGGGSRGPGGNPPPP